MQRGIGTLGFADLRGSRRDILPNGLTARARPRSRRGSITSALATARPVRPP
jgi:hypothetical protein